MRTFLSVLMAILCLAMAVITVIELWAIVDFATHINIKDLLGRLM